jgi:membrane protease YdiL (CAAX protease family)
MRDVVGVLGATVGALLWLLAWQRFLPRPPERALHEEFEERPSASLLFAALALFLIVPVPFVNALGLRPETAGAMSFPERMVIGLAASVLSGPVVVLLVLVTASIQRTPFWIIGLTRRGLLPALVEGFRCWWEWLPLVACVNTLVRLTTAKQSGQTNPVEYVLLNHPPPEIAWWAAAAAVIRAPIVEELVFRGLFQTWFNVFTAWPGILCASIVFAAVHSSAWPDPIPLVLVGMMLGVAYQRTRNLLAPVFAHALFNGVMTILALTVGA